MIYLPGCERDRRASVLMELKKAGDSWEPQLKRLAKNVLRLEVDTTASSTRCWLS